MSQTAARADWPTRLRSIQLRLVGKRVTDWMGWIARHRPLLSPGWAVVLLALCVYLVVLIRTAWVSDDAYVTYRTIANLASGHGPVWNVAERVQAYTHPLWMLILAAGVYFTHEFYFTGLAISMLVSFSAVALLAGLVARTPMQAALALGGLIGSRAFVDYSTSGLENPLTHLLLVGYLVVYFRGEGHRRRLLALSLLAAALCLSRLDAILLVLPSLLYAAWQRRWLRALRALAVGLLPLALWEIFSIVYYGFPFPNTAYAKLATGVPTSELVQQGLYYLLNAINVDPLTPVLILAGPLAAVALHRNLTRLIALGAVLYLVYVVRIGGDFMSGRFLTAPLIVSVALLARLRMRDRGAVVGLFLVIALGFVAPYPTLASSMDYGGQGQPRIDRWGVSDERAFYYLGTGLLQVGRHVEMPNHPWVQEGLAVRGEDRALVVPVGAGLFGFYAGSGPHLVDLVGLADPLLARLPPAPDPFWRIGHFERRIPDGYLESLNSGDNRISEPHLREYYDQLAAIVRGPLFNARRWGAIWRVNLGHYDRLIKAYWDSLPSEFSIEEVRQAEASGNAIAIPADGLRVRLGARWHARQIRFRLTGSVDYLAVFTLASREVSRKLIPIRGGDGSTIADQIVGVSADVAVTGYDAVTLYPADAPGGLILAEIEILED